MVSISKTPDCSNLNDQSTARFGFSVLILVGTFFVYLPQQYRIVRRRSCEGISAWFLLFGVTNGFSSFLNIIILSLDIFECCKEIPTGQCVSAVMGVAQIGAQWWCMVIILLLWMIFFRNTVLEHPEAPHDTYATAVLTVIVCVIHFVLSCIVFAILYLYRFSAMNTYGHVHGIMAAILATIQFLPQIYVTWKLQHIGSFSVPTLAMQAPGSFVFVATLIGRPGTDWSTWLNYIATGVCMMILLVLCLWYSWRDRREQIKMEREAGIERKFKWKELPRKILKWIFH